MQPLYICRTPCVQFRPIVLGRTTFGSPKSIYISNPNTSIKQIEQFNMSPGLRKKAQDAQDAVLRFLKFSVSVVLTRRLRFLRFLRFSVYYAIYKMNRGFEIFEVFSFNRTDKAFEIFLSNGDSGYYNLLEGVPSRWPPRSGIIPPKALRILVGSVPKSLPRYKVPFCMR